ncbi:hypothetical protein CYMTET_9830 [Cymbomonas tetramitiformis]|uniref:Uncharacterized protein n=1 Tax=Cymbomonas tetramitiformis TaxID=36881 RepID=A0AAE0GQB4_9CHLO|nr:hypothetical protein CYMTET_9830 [Cymbomonas tetramitiformis]
METGQLSSTGEPSGTADVRTSPPFKQVPLKAALAPVDSNVTRAEQASAVLEEGSKELELTSPSDVLATRDIDLVAPETSRKSEKRSSRNRAFGLSSPNKGTNLMKIYFLMNRTFWPRVESECWNHTLVRRGWTPLGWFEDFWFHSLNFHPILSIFMAHEYNPLKPRKALVLEIFVLCWVIHWTAVLKWLALGDYGRQAWDHSLLETMGELLFYYVGVTCLVTVPSSLLHQTLRAMIVCPCLYYNRKACCCCPIERRPRWVTFTKRAGETTSWIVITFSAVILLWSTILIVDTAEHLMYLLLGRIQAYLVYFLLNALLLFNPHTEFTLFCVVVVGKWAAERREWSEETGLWQPPLLTGSGLCLCGCCAPADVKCCECRKEKFRCYCCYHCRGRCPRDEVVFHRTSSPSLVCRSSFVFDPTRATDLEGIDVIGIVSDIDTVLDSREAS